MKNYLTGLLTAIIINILAVLACAAGSPVTLTHTLTGYSKGTTAVTLDYSLHVVNPGHTAISDLSLSLVPRHPFVTTTATVNVSHLAPKESADLRVTLVTPLLLDKDNLSRRSLSWAGKGVTAEGKLIEFPVKSSPGGAR